MSREAKLLAGWALWAVGAWLLYDGYVRRGDGAPWPLGAVMPF